MAIDPVCGMEVNETATQDRSTFNGQTYYFCSADCREEFDMAPEDYVGGEEDTRKTGT